MNKIEVKDLSKIYNPGQENEVRALNEVSFSLEEGSFTIILGASGAGKSTLLNILGGMDNATGGSYLIGNEDVAKYDFKELSRFRREDIGFVFQFYNLMPSLTAYENVYLASSLVEKHFDPMEVLKLVGLEDRAWNFPSQLSGGEQQRVAIARAIVKNPTLILADEPTGALDSKTGASIISLLHNICKEQKKTVIIVTHNKAISVIADRIIKVEDGEIVSNLRILNPKKVEDIER